MEEDHHLHSEDEETISLLCGMNNFGDTSSLIFLHEQYCPHFSLFTKFSIFNKMIEQLDICGLVFFKQIKPI